MRPGRYWWSISWLWVVAACASTEYVALRAPPHPIAERPPGSVLMLTERPSEDHTTIGIVSARGRSLGAVFDALRERAASQGCDAVHVRGGGQETIVTENASGVVTNYHGDCIVFDDAPPASEHPRGAPSPQRARPSDVERSRDASGLVVMSTHVEGQGLRLSLRATPEKDREHVEVAMGVKRKALSATELAAPSHGECQVRIEWGHEGEDLETAVEVKGEWEMLSVPGNLGLIERMAKGASVIMTACQTRFGISQATRAKLRNFARDVREYGQYLDAAAARGSRSNPPPLSAEPTTSPAVPEL